MTAIPSTRLNAFEVFEIAERIERNGARFYRRAAENVSEKNLHQILLSLADMGDDHEKIFADIRKHLLYEERKLIVFEPVTEIARWLCEVADGHVFELGQGLDQQLMSKKTAEDILKMAIALEKDSIVFYLGLKDFVSVQAGKDKVDAVIKEEMDHISLLNKQLKQHLASRQ